jgi:hypothetical protein
MFPQIRIEQQLRVVDEISRFLGHPVEEQGASGRGDQLEARQIAT